jgi:hypothetical protein
MKIHTPFLRVGPAVLVAAVLLAPLCSAHRAENNVAHDHLQPLSSVLEQKFQWSREGKDVTIDPSLANLRTTWTYLGLTSDRKMSGYKCTIDLEPLGKDKDGKDQEIRLSLCTLGIQGRKFHVMILSNDPDISLWRQERGAPDGLVPIKSADIESWRLWKIKPTGRSHWPIFGNPNPPDPDGADFIVLKKSCELWLVAERWSHLPALSEEETAKARLYLASRPEKETMNMPPPLRMMIPTILTNHDTTPPPPEGGGVDGDSSR